MSKNVVISVFVALFVVMLLDLIFNFPILVKAIFYGGCFIAGVVIYFVNPVKPTIKDKE